MPGDRSDALTLRKDRWPDAYVATGPLDGPGRRTVRRLEWRGPSGDLSVLERFEDLEDLGLLGIGDCAIPAPLRLPAGLRDLTVVNDAPDVDGEPVRRLVEAIDFDRLGDLRALTLRVGGLTSLAPIAVDLGFVAALPALERLDVYQGVLHAGPGPSPLAPPFPGLPRSLAWVRISAVDPEPVRAALVDHVGHDYDVSVFERSEDAPRGEWEISDGSAYGSLLRSEGGATEYDAAERAQRRLREADPALAARVEFDSENAGTGISAAERDDVVAALRILGLVG